LVSVYSLLALAVFFLDFLFAVRRFVSCGGPRFLTSSTFAAISFHYHIMELMGWYPKRDAVHQLLVLRSCWPMKINGFVESIGV
jgi:hypothetical protein